MTVAKQRFASALSLITAGMLCLLAGCGQPAAPSGDLLVVGFNENQTLRYRLRAEREVQIELTGDKPGETKAASDTMELVMAIRPVEVNPFGLTTLEFTCESAKVAHRSFTGKPGNPDAVESLQGKTYTIQISPTGSLETSDEFETMLKEIGEKSFVSTKTSGQRVKDPDMIFDWMYFQLYLWDAVTSIQEPLAGVEEGTQWTSRQVVPWPVPIYNMPTRQVTYTLAEVRPTETGRQAVITSNYGLSEEPIKDFPLPYTGTFQLKGSLFAVLHSYRFQSLEGAGTQIFNMDTGTLESDEQQYTLKARADFILPLGNSIPILTVDQKFSVQLLNPPSGESDRAAQ